MRLVLWKKWYVLNSLAFCEVDRINEEILTFSTFHTSFNSGVLHSDWSCTTLWIRFD
jgi:hypothetical protein